MSESLVLLMENNRPKSKTPPELKDLRERVQFLHPTVYWLLHEFIIWNDICRYPALPLGDSNVDRLMRNRFNKLQMSHFYGPFKRSIMLHLWALAFENQKKAPPLRSIAREIFESENNFAISDELKSKLKDTEDFFEGQGIEKIFEMNRHKFIAHVESISLSPKNYVDDPPLYRLVPKAIYLAELLHLELLGFPNHYDNQFKTLSEEVAPLFHHTRPDDLLARLFSQRSLPGRILIVLPKNSSLPSVNASVFEAALSSGGELRIALPRRIGPRRGLNTASD